MSTIDPRVRMIDAAARLLAAGGYQSASFSEVLAVSGAPRGSIYHHFPGGKDELVAAALQVQADRVVAMIADVTASDPEDVVDRFAAAWRVALERTDFEVGCSLVGVVVSTEGVLRADAGRLFVRWRAALAHAFVTAGVKVAEAESFAAELLAAVEGAVVIARAERSLHVFDLVVTRLRDAAASLPRAHR